jgi:hypothetical protein
MAQFTHLLSQRDAVLITRHLHIQHLWIDSLRIIQSEDKGEVLLRALSILEPNHQECMSRDCRCAVAIFF